MDDPAGCLMHILMLHNRYRLRGGEDAVFEAERALLTSHGHRVTDYVQDNRATSGVSAWRLGLRGVWSTDAYRSVRGMIRRVRPDLVHVHNFFPLISPAAYYAAKAESLPVVQTLHNYRLFCANGLFFRDGHACEECLGKLIPWPGMVHACYRGSHAASGAVAAMLTVHRLLDTWNKKVDMYITPTEFARRKFVEAGLPANKIAVKPHFVYPDPGPGPARRSYALFVGRLAPEKGVDTLLAAWTRVGRHLPLKIVGDGPLADRVAAATQRLAGVEWLGERSEEDVLRLMEKAAVLICPSQSYETFLRVVVEGFAKSAPAVVAGGSAAAEVVDDGRTGLHFRQGDTDDLADKMDWLCAHPNELRRMGREARYEFVAKYGADRNYKLLMEIYTRAAGAIFRLDEAPFASVMSESPPPREPQSTIGST